MRRCWPVLIILGATLLLARTASADLAFNFTSIDFPVDANHNLENHTLVLTNAQGINHEGDIVGFYQEYDDQDLTKTPKQHGFLLRNGNFTSIDIPDDVASLDFPNAKVISTDARGISPDGDIVGSYTIAPGGPPNIHGYLLRQGTFSTVQFPQHLGTIAQRISSHGDIYGCYHDTDLMGTMHGFVRTPEGHFAERFDRWRDDSKRDHDFEEHRNDSWRDVDRDLMEGWTGLDVPASMNNGATPSGNIIVGLFTDMMTGLSHGFVLDFGTFFPFDVPGGIFTNAWDISPEGEIVGVFQDTNKKFHGFLRTRDGEFTSVDYPGAILTRAFGINPRGEIVGIYADTNGKTHAYLRSRTEDRDDDHDRDHDHDHNPRP
jgi:hypothetical protein